jgi:hypothetical protein
VKVMPKRKAPEHDPETPAGMDDPEQSQRFMEAARELGCEETGEAFERALARILPARKPGEPAPKREPRAKPPGRRRRTKSPK